MIYEYLFWHTILRYILLRNQTDFWKWFWYKNYTFTLKENTGFSYQTNSYELTNLCVDTFKTHAISGSNLDGSKKQRFSLDRRLHFVLTINVIKRLLYDTFGTCNIFNIMKWVELLCLYYVVNVLWYPYEVPTLRCFRRQIWGCDRLVSEPLTIAN